MKSTNLKNKIGLSTIRIYLTENCNAKCSHCFNVKIREPKHMNFNYIPSLFEYLRKNGIVDIKIMGGEPTIYPQFREVYAIAQSIFQNVSLFTNALNEEILEINPKPGDAIVYNFIFINNKFNFLKLLPEYKGFNRVFETVVGINTNLKNLFKSIEYTYSKCLELKIPKNEIQFQLTYDCTENIFSFKEELNNKFKKTIEFILSLNSDLLSFDHSVPYCFWTSSILDYFDRSNIDILKKYPERTCSGKFVGLIDSDFFLLHCNQHPVRLVNLVNKQNGEYSFIDFDIVINYLLKSNLEKRLINLNKNCLNCKYFYNPCTGSCFMHKDFITKD